MGNALVDIMTMIDGDHFLEIFKLPKGSMQLVNTETSENIKSVTKSFRHILASGGSAANTIHGLSMLGSDAGFIGSIGNDSNGDFFENDMRDAGVHTHLFRRKSVTGTAVALITPDSERTFATHLGAAIELGPSDINPQLLKNYDILYLEGYLINNYPLVEKACRLAKENDMLVSLDLASFNVVETYLKEYKIIVDKYIDILFANELEAMAFTGHGPEEAISCLSAPDKISVIKIGSKGSIVSQNSEVIKIDALPVNCNDTTGAGDLYAAGFLYGFSQGMSLIKCGQIGSLLAGRVIENYGARMNARKFKHIRKEAEKIARL